MTKEAILAVLEQREGTTISTIMAATGWQEHSVSGSFLFVVRKNLGWTLVSCSHWCRSSVRNLECPLFQCVVVSFDRKKENNP